MELWPAVIVSAGVGAAGLGISCLGSDAPSSPPPPAPTLGAGTVAFGPRMTFQVPAADMPAANKPDFYAGQALARQPWVKAPTITDARDGLGPLYNARACLVCHERAGRGIVPHEDGPLAVATLVRLGRQTEEGWVDDPVYGGQLQPRSTDAAYALGGDDVDMPGEAVPVVHWLEETVDYADGKQAKLRKPKVELTELGYGPLHEGTKTGLRHAPPLYGLGLIDKIPEAAIRAKADPDDKDRDGVSGRAARAYDIAAKSWTLGRFGLKATQPSLRQQIAAAIANDIGITNSLYPEESCTERQAACKAAPTGRGPEGLEMVDRLLGLIELYNANLGVPAPRKPDHPMVREGEAHFAAFGCTSCHTPQYETDVGPISPYTDLLLHDMGPGLAEPLAEGSAEGAEWRTPPLWGVGLARAVHDKAGLLHDGRARNVEEAVLWHGGEAAASRARFVEAPAAARRALLAFVRSI